MEILMIEAILNFRKGNPEAKILSCSVFDYIEKNCCIIRAIFVIEYYYDDKTKVYKTFEYMKGEF